MRAIALLLSLALGLTVLTGCESTFDQAARARKAAGKIAKVDAMSMQQLQGVTAKTLAIIPSADGMTAAVVVQVDAAQKGQSVIWAPIEVKLLDAAGKDVGTNNIPGALPILVHLPSVEGGASAVYVNDQILLSGKPASATVIVGGAFTPGPGLGLLKTSPVKVVPDPNLGTSWTTTVSNTTSVRQESVVVQAVVTSNGRVVGAGTANIDGLDPGASADVTGYFIGSDKGDVTVTAPASNGPGGIGAPAPKDASGSATTVATTSSSVSTPTMTLQVN
jgi:hypothetical protein